MSATGNVGATLESLGMDYGADLRSDLIDLATFGSIKENPNCKIVGEVFEPVCSSRSSKQNIVRLETFPRVSTNEFACSVRYYINFISRMWRPIIVAARRI